MIKRLIGPRPLAAVLIALLAAAGCQMQSARPMALTGDDDSAGVQQTSEYEHIVRGHRNAK